MKELGQFQLISDVIGGFSYTTTLSMFIERVLSLLEVNGNFYTVLQDVHAEDGSNKPYYEGSGFLTEIARADGSELKVCPWLKSITCVEVTCELKSKWQPPIEVYRIHKTCSDVKVPALSTIFYQAGTPPKRAAFDWSIERGTGVPTKVVARPEAASTRYAKLSLASSLAVVAAITHGIAHAQTYPAKPIRLVVPLAPGGGNDTLARYVGKYLTESLGNPWWSKTAPEAADWRRRICGAARRPMAIPWSWQDQA